MTAKPFFTNNRTVFEEFPAPSKAVEREEAAETPPLENPVLPVDGDQATAAKSPASTREADAKRRIAASVLVMQRDMGGSLVVGVASTKR